MDLFRRHIDSEVNQFAQTTGKPVADFAQRVDVGQLAEQHRDQLRPATEAFCGPFGPVFLYQRRELEAREVPVPIRIALLLGIRQPNARSKDSSALEQL